MVLHHVASNANSAKIGDPCFSFVQFYMKTEAVIESLKKFSGADFTLLVKTVIFEWL